MDVLAVELDVSQLFSLSWLDVPHDQNQKSIMLPFSSFLSCPLTTLYPLQLEHATPKKRTPPGSP